MRPDAFDLLIVGAGPGGLSAARVAAAQGLRVALVDEQPRIGGQVFRQAPAAFGAPPPEAMRSYPFGRALFAWAQADQSVRWLLGTTVWGLFAHHGDDDYAHEVGLAGPDGAYMLRCKRVLIAAGAYDMPVALPGWTLPGVMTAGGVQTLLKSQSVLPGRRFLLAGGHPLLFLLAEQLLDAGATLAGVVISRPLPRFDALCRAALAAAGQLHLLRQMLRILARLRRQGVRVRFNQGIRRVHGELAVESVTLCRTDVEDPASDQTLAVDTVVLGYGLLASTELARQAGCETHWAGAAGGWLVRHDAQMRSSVATILVAGEQTGIGGAFNAHLQGELAAWQCARELAAASAAQADAAMARLQRRVRRNARFTQAVIEMADPELPALVRRITPDTVVCRCEEVTAGTVQTFMCEHGYVRDINSIKLACRTGMGMCQGRYCQHTVAQMLADHLQCDPAAVGQYRSQVPVKPVPVGQLAAMSLPADA